MHMFQTQAAQVAFELGKSIWHGFECMQLHLPGGATYDFQTEKTDVGAGIANNRLWLVQQLFEIVIEIIQHLPIDHRFFVVGRLKNSLMTA